MRHQMTADLLTLDKDDVASVIDVLCEAFFDYPAMRYVLGPGRPDYKSELETLVSLFVIARVWREEFLLGVRDGTGLVAAAIVSRPTGAPAPPEFYELRERVWAELGPEAEARYDAFGDACAPFQVEAPHLHLNMIGVRGSAQGRGLARPLLERVHQLSRTDSESQGVTLSTEIEANVSLYEYFGYRLVGRGSRVIGADVLGLLQAGSSVMSPKERHVRQVALIRGINVGKAKRVAMADLRALMERLGYGDCRTLHNSGNVIFTARA